jgi:hypothetical protein
MFEIGVSNSDKGFKKSYMPKNILLMFELVLFAFM